MPTDLKALVDPLLYLEKNYQRVAAKDRLWRSNGQSLAFDLLRTLRLLLREIVRYGKGDKAPAPEGR